MKKTDFSEGRNTYSESIDKIRVEIANTKVGFILILKKHHL